MKRSVGIWAIVLAAVFLAGFLPQFVKARRLEGELGQAQRQSAGAQLRDLAALAYLQANQKNYGLAAETMGRYFPLAGEYAARPENAAAKQTVESLLGLRDPVTAQLAKADPGVMKDLERILLETREATR